MNRKKCFCLLVSLAMARSAEAITLDPFAWMKVDYGFSKDYFGEENGKDQMGTAQVALGTEANYENLVFTGLIGADRLSILGEGPIFEIRETYFEWNKVGGTNLSASFGVQPFLFGLKATGFTGDRSLIPSLEFSPMGPDSFVVSSQTVPSVKLRYDFMDNAILTVGAFDNNLTNAFRGAPPDNGSNILDNQFAYLRVHGGGWLAGLYGFAGTERAYVGRDVDETRYVFDGGLGFKIPLVDISGEYISIPEAIAGTEDRETLLVGELTAMPGDQYSAYADYSTALESKVQTLRFGVMAKSHDILTWIFEYSLNIPNGQENTQGYVGRALIAF